MGIVLEDIFEVTQRDPDGKKFDKVSRYECKSDLYEFYSLLDVNIEVYPLKVGDKFTLALATSLFKDNKKLDKYDASFPSVSGAKSLMDDYEYVMHGKVFKFKDKEGQGHVKVQVFISFGGLLLQLEGDPRKLEVLEVDSNVYLLMRKV